MVVVVVVEVLQCKEKGSKNVSNHQLYSHWVLGIEHFRILPYNMYSIWLEKSNIAVIFIQNSGGHMKDNKNRDQPVVVVDGGGGPAI